MPLEIVRNDITKMAVDAIVNAANSSLLGGGGVDGTIHKAAGPSLLKECRTLGGCAIGEAKITGAYNLPCRYVIHTVGPVWQGGDSGESDQLAACYRNSLELAVKYGCETVAFPLISSGAYGYPKDKAMRVAMNVISSFLFENELTVYIVVFDKEAYSVGGKLFADIAEYIDDRYIDEHLHIRKRLLETENMQARFWMRDAASFCKSSEAPLESAPVCCSYSYESLDEILETVDESFSQMLLRKIDEKGMTDAECYKKANIDRKLFSKIRNDINYKPKKVTAIAFAISLELTLAETKELLEKAGFALSHSSKFDIIIEYFISKGNYNVFEINEVLFSFDQSLLGV
ncbi:MAG: O-acetyl-ADP-ribose deacetylase [Clostridia bacterium]|nr:O-acetyl-ADP-ribose deacetylase [Clostridia bacterium]